MELVLQIAAQLFVAGALYGAIRADLRHVLEQANKAHARIDQLLENCRMASMTRVSCDFAPK